SSASTRSWKRPRADGAASAARRSGSFRRRSTSGGGASSSTRAGATASTAPPWPSSPRGRSWTPSAGSLARGLERGDQIPQETVHVHHQADRLERTAVHQLG